MAQQSKMTSRPMTKALGTASILSMAIAGANMANAIQTDFGVDYRADAFYLDGDAYGDDGSGNGLANLLRLKADLKHEETGVSLHTSIQLAGDTWSGDSRTDGSSGFGYNNQGNETVTLDTGYVQIPIAGNLLRVGRQAANWNNCFLTCDDRRDRIGGVFPTKVGTFVALYDRRADNFSGDNFNSSDSGDATVLAYITRLGGFNVGLLYNHYYKNSGEDAVYPIQGGHVFSPYISGSLTEGLNLTIGANWLGGNEENDENTIFGDGTQYENLVYDGEFNAEGVDYGDAFSGYIRLDGDVGALNWGIQYVAAIDGGFIDPGFDTYFSTVNNNPSNTGNPTSLISLGRGYGMEDYDQHLLAAKLGFDITPKFNLTGAVGYMRIDNGQFDNDDSSMLYDLSANYKLNDAVTFIGTLGVVGNNEAFTAGTLSNPITGDFIANSHPAAAGNQFGVGTPTDFDDEDLMAAKVGMRVSF